LHRILAASPRLAEVTADPERYRLQIVLGLVETVDGRPVLRQHGYRLDAEYFYPASAVKPLAAVAALEHLKALRETTGLDLTIDTPLVYSPLFPGEVEVSRDPSNHTGGTVTLRHEIRKMLLVSDNEAFNRLYELVGPDGLARTLSRAGLPDAWIVHRLAEARTPAENLRLPRIDFVGPDFRHTLPRRDVPEPAPASAVPGLLVGRAHLERGRHLPTPFDFSDRNRVPLADLQRALCMIVRPEVDCGAGRLNLDSADRELLREALSQYPRESANPVYDPADYPDTWGKFLLPGLDRVLPRERFRIHNKNGLAYGFNLDNAWVEDTETGRGFFLAVTLYTNANGVVNDNRYEHVAVALPFLAALGEAVAREVWETP
jgi:hypothetical protein